MTEYIFCVPDENQPIAGDSSVYYPDERDEPMCVREEIVRCRDCKHYDPHPTDGGVCFLPDGDGGFAYWEVEPDGFCKWGEKRDK